MTEKLPPLAVHAAGALRPDLVAGPVPVPDGEHPHTHLRAGTAVGLGVLAGRSWWVERPVAMHADDVFRPVVTLEGFPLALSGRVGGAAVVVTATASLHEALSTAGPCGAHPPVPVVDASRWRPAVDREVARAGGDVVRAAGRAARGMPEVVHDALVDFADGPGPSGAVLLRGVDLGRVPATPAGPDRGAVRDHSSEFALLAVARRLGQPVGYSAELGGRLVQDIVPTKDTARAQVSTSSRVRLDWHTEAAFHPHRPRYLVLGCLRGDRDAATLLCSVRHLVGVLDPGDVAVLRERGYRTRVDESYLGHRGTVAGPAGPVVSGPAGAERLWFDADLMDGVEGRHRRALSALREAVEEHHVSVTLDAGDVLVVDNDIAVHGRSEFEPRFDGTDRWLQRTFVVSDLASSASEREGRIVDTWFLGPGWDGGR